MNRRLAAPTRQTDYRFGKPETSSVRALLCGVSLLVVSTPSYGSELLEVGVSYQGDLVSSWGDGLNGRGRALDSLHVTTDSDLSSLLPWNGLLFHTDVNMTSGAAPNDDAGTLQGVSNIEVSGQRTRLYEIWLEQKLFGDSGSVRVGFQDLNAEFNVTESSSYLLNPSFGISPELASTGSNGASTFPSTALGLRGFMSLADDVQLNVAAFNADALSIGDVGGPDTAFSNGALVIGQLSWTGPFRLSVGAWGYTDQQADIRELDVNGDPLLQSAQGAYVLAEKALFGKEGERRTFGFFRGGISDGNTTQFRGAWQAGVLVERPLLARPESAFSAGLAQALTSVKSRANARDVGIEPARNETIFEVTYSDKLSPWISLQPSLQYTNNPGGDAGRSEVLTAALRLTLEPRLGR